MSSKVDIINAAFILLGHHSVNNLGDNAGEDVKKAISLYNIYYLSFLTYYPWRFALKQFPLSEASSFDPVTGYENAYVLPNDYLQIYKLDPNGQYEIYGQLLYTNQGPTDIVLYYTAYVGEENLPEYYVEFLVEKFAELFAMPITQQPEIAQLWGQSASLKLNRAMALDCQQQTSLSIQYNPLGMAKYNFNSGL